jgi:hypothetical protein
MNVEELIADLAEKGQWEKVEALLSTLVEGKQWDAIKRIFIARDQARMVKMLAESGAAN